MIIRGAPSASRPPLFTLRAPFAVRPRSINALKSIAAISLVSAKLRSATRLVLRPPCRTVLTPHASRANPKGADLRVLILK